MRTAARRSCRLANAASLLAASASRAREKRRLAVIRLSSALPRASTRVPLQASCTWLWAKPAAGSKGNSRGTTQASLKVWNRVKMWNWLNI